MKRQVPLEVVILLGFLIVAVAAWALLIRPLGAERDSVSAESADLEVALEAQRAARRDAGLNATPELKYAYGFDLTRALPDDHDVPRMLLELDAISAESGVSFDAIQPGAPTERGATSALPVSVTFEGDYDKMRDSIEAIRRVTRVRNETVRSAGRLYTVDGFDFHESADGFPSVEATVEISAHAMGTPIAPEPEPEPETDDSTSDDGSGDSAEDAAADGTDASAGQEGP